jgi:hypothetical protein
LLLRLFVSLGLAVVCWAQQAAPPSRLKINIISGEGAVNNIPMRVAAQPGVEVLDEKDSPVEGAVVIFQAPAQGPSGTFYGGMSQHQVKTDSKGRATATGFIPNDQAGKLRIQVRATAGSAVAEVVINQSNSQGPGNGAKASSNKKVIWTVVAIAAAVGIAGGVAASNSGGSSDTTSKKPVSIGAGPITVGGPR